MVIDTLDNLYKYIGLCPSLQTVVGYLLSHPLETLADGKHEVAGAEVWVNVQTCQPRTREQAPLEVHRDMMDIQIPIDGPEEHGFAPLTEEQVLSAAYDQEADISFLSNSPQAYFNVCPGQFVLYLPGEGHAPAITDNLLKKAVFKVKYQIPNNHA